MSVEKNAELYVCLLEGWMFRLYRAASAVHGGGRHRAKESVIKCDDAHGYTGRCKVISGAGGK